MEQYKVGRNMIEHRNLWRDAFGDTEAYMDYYFGRKASRSRCIEAREGECLCAMAFFTPYDAVLYGRTMVLPYIVGVATKEEFRHQGRMTAVMREGLKGEIERGSALAFLSPANPAIYEPLGFLPTYWRDTLQLTGEGKECCEVRIWSELTETDKERLSHLAEDILEREKFDLRLVHSVSYYNEVHTELQALGGGLLSFWNGNTPLAAANWICEEGKHEVTEWIGVPEWRERVLQTLQCYVEADVYVEDTYFLEGLRLSGMQRKKQEYPYLMVRMLDASLPMPKRCYINDIT